jgi:uncharacterized protein DUF6968
VARSLGRVIARRKLARTGSDRPVVVEIGVPRRRRTGEWACPYRISGLRKRASGRALGEDAVQALELVFQAIWLELKPYGLELSWAGLPGATGFYRYYPDYTLGLEFAQRVEAAIDREVHKEYRKLKRRYDKTQARRKRGRKSPRA